MKKHPNLILFPFVVALLIIMVNCKKEVSEATLSTQLVTQITTNTAQSGGSITNDGGGQITSYGLVWSSLSNPALEQHSGLTMDGRGQGTFESIMTGLKPNTTYFVRAYATNEAGIRGL